MQSLLSAKKTECVFTMQEQSLTGVRWVDLRRKKRMEKKKQWNHKTGLDRS